MHMCLRFPGCLFPELERAGFLLLFGATFKSDHRVGTVWGLCVKGRNNLEAKKVGNLDPTDLLTLTSTKKKNMSIV